MQRALITGASGFIGSHCLPILEAKANEVHATDLTRKRNKFDRNTTWHQVDLMEPDQIYQLLSKIKPTHLLHLAWHLPTGSQVNSFKNYDWVKVGIELVQAFAQFGGKRIVVAGSCAEYDWRYAFCSEKLTPLNPGNPYGVCKNALHLILDSFCRQRKIGFAWGRIFFTYGPRENPKRLVASVIRSLLKGTSAKCTHGHQMRDFLYVKDVADALVSLLASNVQGPVNVASGHPISLKEIIFAIRDLMKVEHDLIELGAIPAALNEPPLLVGDNTRLRKEVMWQPQFNLDRGLTDTIEWWKKNTIDK